MDDFLNEALREADEDDAWTGEYMEDEMDEIIREVLRRELPGRNILRN